MLRDELRRGAAALAEAGCESPGLDAELLLAAAIGVDRAQLVIGARDSLAGEATERYERMLARRIAREPVAYILGRKHFRRLALSVDRNVLIPRPESEMLVEVGLTLAPGTRVADVGTGSGALALALKDERPDLIVAGIDCSDAALAVARANGARLGLSVSWVQSDLLDGRDYDAVLANLPYVADDAVLAPEITRYEPVRALFAGADGLDLIRRLVAIVAQRADVSLLALEIGCGQADDVCALLAGAGLGSVSRLRDLAGHERVIVGRR
ncbi:MAG: peptide chain release factor N(5)-glutamine methyltransferase [Solirubrobacteraceae bacterium]